jgi:glycosyl transferase family 2
MFDALRAQTIASELEVIVVDTRPGSAMLPVPDMPVTKVVDGGSLSYGEARARAVREARADVVAFVEDHCYPEPGWAEHLRTAFERQWAALGYAISNADRRALRSRIIHLATYGQWQAPARGPTNALPGGNVAYRRQALLDLGEDLPAMLQTDFNIHARLRARGLTLAIEPNARVEHVSGESLVDALRASFVYSRVLAANRARFGRWSSMRRIAWAIGNLGGAPVTRLVGLIRGLRRSPSELARVAAYLPAILTIYVVGAAGETVGYLVGEGRGAQALLYWEIDAPRTHE